MEYEHRRQARQREAARLQVRQARWSQARLAAALAGVALFWLTLVDGGASPAWMGLPIVLFIGLVVGQERELRRLRAATRAARFYEHGLARLDGSWPGTGETGERFRDVHHAYSESLDLFGRGSLFELLCSARTQAGEETLARWLTSAAPPDEIGRRQGRVAELRDRLDLREALSLAGEDLRAAVHPGRLAAWGEAAPVGGMRAHRWVGYILPLLTMAGLAAWAWQGSRIPFLVALLAQSVYAYSVRPKVQEVLEGLDQPAGELALLSALLEQLAGEPAADLLPSPAPLRRLSRLVSFVEMRRNQFFAPIAALLLWGLHCASAVELWRREHGHAIRGWLEALGEFEALNSLAGYSWEHPSDPFPEIVAGPALFDGEALAHPLLEPARAVANSLAVSADAPLLVISGSNMSGKSTMLRTVGVNTVLAQAGAPVRARRLRLSPLRLGASIRVVDSLAEGSSRFFAEIQQLRRLLGQTAEPPALLFLLDELLSGTNSHDRRIGAAGILQGFLARGAIGMITTHDLALTEMDALNVHFEDRLEGGQIHFDYTLRSGVVARSNALELMRSIGLDV